MLFLKEAIIAILAFIGLSSPQVSEIPLNTSQGQIEDIEVVLEVDKIATTSEEKLLDDIACYCSRWAKSRDVNIPVTHAKYLRSSSTPQVGGGVLFKYGESDRIEDYHIAVILYLLEYGMWIREANFVPCQITERFVSYNDSYIVGFVDRVQPL